MREIKFRGLTQRGVIVYGDLTHSNGDIFIDDYRVLPESVQQLCGRDENDDEVYEGDVVINHGTKYTVKLAPKYGLFYNLKSARKE
mgnify:CR=1 FL=1